MASTPTLCTICVAGSNRPQGHRGPHTRLTPSQRIRRHGLSCRRSRSRRRQGHLHMAACASTIDAPVHPDVDSNVGRMHNECVHCGALLFDGEITRSRCVCCCFLFLFLLQCLLFTVNTMSFKFLFHCSLFARFAVNTVLLDFVVRMATCNYQITVGHHKHYGTY